MTASAYPLEWPEGWPRTHIDSRKSNSPFQTTFDRARNDLRNELKLLRAGNVVISSWLPLRNDGEPRADVARRRIDDPGVAVYFTLRGRQMVMARDTYWSVHDNLRSICLAISHLRGLERHGGATMMERAFEGFAALPPPTGSKPARPWPEVLEIPAEAPVWMIEAAFKHKAKVCHPDAGGSDAMMAELNAARDQAMKERA